MEPSKAAPKTTTVTVDLQPEDIEALRAFARKRGISMSAALQRAIRQASRLDQLLAEGGTLILEDTDRNFTKLVPR